MLLTHASLCLSAGLHIVHIHLSYHHHTLSLSLPLPYLILLHIPLNQSWMHDSRRLLHQQRSHWNEHVGSTHVAHIGVHCLSGVLQLGSEVGIGEV
jgi:hypothetical protein